MSESILLVEWEGESLVNDDDAIDAIDAQKVSAGEREGDCNNLVQREALVEVVDEEAVYLTTWYLDQYYVIRLFGYSVVSPFHVVSIQGLACTNRRDGGGRT